MGLRTISVGYLDGVLLMESLLIVLLDRRFDVCDRNCLLRTRLVHGDRVRPVLVECRLLG